jgi:alpha-glucosidase
MLTLHRRLIALRRAESALNVGEYAPLEAPGDLIVYLREYEMRRFAIALNLSVKAETFELATPLLPGRIVLSTHLDRKDEPVSGIVGLRANEGVIIEVA